MVRPIGIRREGCDDGVFLREVILGEDPLDIDPLYTKMILRAGGAGAIAGVTVTEQSAEWR